MPRFCSRGLVRARDWASDHELWRRHETLEVARVKNGAILVYTVGRTYLFDLLLRELQDETSSHSRWSKQPFALMSS